MVACGSRNRIGFELGFHTSEKWVNFWKFNLKNWDSSVSPWLLFLLLLSLSFVFDRCPSSTLVIFAIITTALYMFFFCSLLFCFRLMIDNCWDHRFSILYLHIKFSQTLEVLVLFPFSSLSVFCGLIFLQNFSPALSGAVFCTYQLTLLALKFKFKGLVLLGNA